MSPLNIAVVQCYGLGNAIMASPLLQALKSMGHRLDVIVERGRASHLAFSGWPEVIDRIWFGSVPRFRRVYDLAVFCHPSSPYVGRCRFKRASEPELRGDGTGYMWRFDRHEVLVLLEMARRIGFQGRPPPLRVPRSSKAKPRIPHNSVAIGIGYLKDHARWAGKHWGNEQYADLCRRLSEQGYSPIIVGDESDQPDGVSISSLASVAFNACGTLPFIQTVELIAQCVGFIGNDSGLMHVAAAVDVPTVGIFRNTNPIKNRPWCTHWDVVENPPDWVPVMASFRQLLERAGT